MKNIIIVILTLIILVGGYLYFNNNLISKSTGTDQKSNLTTEEMVKNRSEEVLKAINEKDINKFKSLIHPTKGVRFSKDGVVYLETDKKLTTSEIESLVISNKVILWGYSDGSGFPINKTFIEYFSQYSNPNYLEAPEVSYDNTLRAGANTTNNIKEKYQNNHFISYHYPYTSTYKNDKGEEVVQPMSWTTLNLVFEEYQDRYYLVGIVRDNWTI